MAFPRPRNTHDRHGDPARSCVVIAPDGQLLSHGRVGPESTASTIVLDDMSQRGALLGYYFARGRRDVIVQIGAFQLQGRLRTQWAGNHREWTVELQPVRTQHGAA